MSAVVPTTDGAILTVKAQPRASTNAVSGIDDEWVRVRLRAPPVDGKANAALTAFLADTLGLHKRAVTILSGETGRLKRVRVTGIDVETVRAKLGIE